MSNTKQAAWWRHEESHLVKQVGGKGFKLPIYNEGGRVIAYVYGDTKKETIANAKVIAASRELLRAVEMSYSILRELPDDYQYEPGESPVEILKAVIDKATNQTHNSNG